MATEEKCDLCGKPIPAWAPGGNCPACLFAKPKPTAEAPATARERIGDWQLHERIGEGAFGVVFAADQERPVRRTAALKILRPGMGKKDILARFEAESQALALMNHPDVVTIYDAGTTEDGRPWFAMEMVPGVPVTQFAKGFSIEKKIELFDRICAVVEHAHGRGIIHRDLKPANILAYEDENGEAAVKLLDFGIAKATDHVLTEATILTGEGNLLGTPEYMSPEQTSEGDIDTRADVYSLGVILFELLTGRPPFVLDSSSLDSVLKFMRRVREDSAPLPSSLSNLEIESDLNWIVGKAIAKDRNRRFKTVSEMRNDLTRFQTNQPVTARPPDTFYLARKFLNRHWRLTAMLATIAMAITGAAIVSSVMAVKAREAASETRRAYSKSDLISAVNNLDSGHLSKAVAQLVRSVRTDPGNEEATMLLRSTLNQYPISELVFRKKLIEQNLRAAFFTGPEGSSVVVTDTGTILFFGSDGNETAPALVVPGTNQIAGISGNKKRLAVTNVQGNFALVDLENKKQLPLEKGSGPDGPYTARIQFSPDDTLLCIASVTGHVDVWNTKSGKRLWNKQMGSTPLSIVFFEKGAGIAIACRNGERFDFDAVTGNPKTDIPQQPEDVHYLVDSRSGFRYYTVSSTGIVAACDQGRPPRTFTGEQVSVPLILTTADPSRRLTAYLSKAEASVWTVDGQTIIKRLSLNDSPTCVTLDSENNVIYIGTAESGIKLWAFGIDQLLGTEISRPKNVEAIQVDSHSGILRCICRDGSLQHYSIPDPPGRDHNSLKLPKGWDAVPLEDRNNHILRTENPDLQNLQDIPKLTPRTIGASRDGKIIFGAFRDGYIRVWDVQSGDLTTSIQPVTASVRCCDISPDGNTLFYRDKFSHFASYDFSTKQIVRFPSLHKRDLSSIAFSPNGNTVAIATDSGVITMIEVRTGKPRVPNLHHDARGSVSPHYCRFSPDGKILASWGELDRAFRFWDVESGKPISAPVITDGTPTFGHFVSSRYFATIARASKHESYFRIWSIWDSLPITPKKRITPNHFDTSRIKLPNAAAFSVDELRRIENSNGLMIGANGFIEVNSE